MVADVTLPFEMVEAYAPYHLGFIFPYQSGGIIQQEFDEILTKTKGIVPGIDTLAGGVFFPNTLLWALIFMDLGIPDGVSKAI